MYKKGTVILVPFPFTDLSGTKVRPAVIVSSGKIGQNILVIFVTSKAKTKEKHLIRIKPDKENGLKANSLLVCAKIATLDVKIVLGELGRVSSDIQDGIDKELKNILGLK